VHILSPSGSFFPLGTTTVTCTATNYSPLGTVCQQATCSFKVTVMKRPLIVKADDKTKRFDGSPFTDFTVSYAGFALGEGPEDLEGALVFSESAVGAVNEGVYEIIPGGLSSPYYDITFVPGTLTILPSYTVIPAGSAGTFVELPAGGAGEFLGEFQGKPVQAEYPVGQPIIVRMRVLDFYGDPVTGPCASVTLIQVDDSGHQTIWYFGTATYDPETGVQQISVPTVPQDGVPAWYPTVGLPTGHYLLLIDLRDGTRYQIVVRLVS
jgi:hypothetical protein